MVSDGEIFWIGTLTNCPRMATCFQFATKTLADRKRKWKLKKLAENLQITCGWQGSIKCIYVQSRFVGLNAIAKMANLLIFSAYQRDPVNARWAFYQTENDPKYKSFVAFSLPYLFIRKTLRNFSKDWFWECKLSSSLVSEIDKLLLNL